jgi:hypothetical protein
VSTPCQCGRPISDTANLCTTCGDNLRRNLGKIADRWPELEAALTTPGVDIEKGKTKNSMVAVGTNVNEQAIAARRACTDVVWFALQVIRDDLDAAGRPFRPPATSATRSQDDTPTVARWLAAWQLAHITHRADRETAEEILRDVENAEGLTFKVCETTPPRRIDTGMPCEGHGTSVEGERVLCDGVMRATLTDTMPDLVCSVDVTHRIPPDVWSRNYWKRAHPMDETAARNLARRIVGA